MDPAGLLHLHRKYALKVPPPLTRSFIHRGANRSEQSGLVTTQLFGPSYHPGDTDRGHLEFALKWEALDLRILAAWFRQPTAAGEISTLIAEKPTGENARRLWFLFEWLQGTTLPSSDGPKRNYVALLDPEKYVVSANPSRSARHHVLNNLAGHPLLCPLVRRTSAVDELIAFDFRAETERLVPSTDLDLLARALSYLYLKETRSSFAIEGESLSSDRDQRFVAQLQEVSKATAVTRDDLVRWQRVIVDQRYAEASWRSDQVYVAEGSRMGRPPKIHYVAPRPQEVAALMDAFLALDHELSHAPPLVHAALWSFAFVFIHPFDDGNGRLHRLLAHNVLHRRGLTPAGVVLPVSAVIVNDRAQYDGVLESFSQPVMEALEGRYTLDDDEVLTVTDDTTDLYRSFDATLMVEGLGRWAKRALEYELVEEIAWLRRYDKTREAVRRVVDMPDKRLHNFIAIVEGNGGVLSARKRSHFPELTDGEVHQMEAAVQEHLLQRPPDPEPAD